NYDTSESKLRREFEAYGKIRQIKLVHDIKTGKPRGYAFVEYEDENSMHAAYKRADGKKIDGRRVVVDIERGRTIKGWKPRRLGGGKAGRKSHYDPMAVEKPSDVNCVEKFEDKKPRDRDRERDREKTRDRHKRSKSRSRSRERKKRSKSKDRHRSRSRERAKKSRRSKSKDRKTSKKRSKSRDKREREGNGKLDRVLSSNDNAEPNGLNNYNNGNGLSNNGTEYGEIL
ncbi:U1 small nuclear ribonucleo 70 kDa, partial [Brachionus plicatilis]